jgi:AcrR family transcriptional regulator
MRSSKSPDRRRADAVANRDALIRAAAALYAERGLDVSVEDIAQAAGVGRATLYRHFPTREQLHVAILEQIVEQIEAAGAELPATATAFMTLFKVAVRVQADSLPVVDLLLRRGAPDDAVRDLRARVRTIFRDPLAAAQHAGLVRADLSPEDVRIQLAMLGSVTRPGAPTADQRRAWRLAMVALGTDQSA